MLYIQDGPKKLETNDDYSNSAGMYKDHGSFCPYPVGFQPYFYGCREWNNRIDFIRKFFDENSTEQEQIKVTTASDSGPYEIYVSYNTVKNKKNIEDSEELSAPLMCALSNEVVAAICENLLKNWRENNDEN
jgi:hypothetical protein